MSDHIEVTEIADVGNVGIYTFSGLPDEAWMVTPVDPDPGEVKEALALAAGVGFTHITDQWLEVDPNTGRTEQFYRLGCR